MLAKQDVQLSYQLRSYISQPMGNVGRPRGLTEVRP